MPDLAEIAEILSGEMVSLSDAARQSGVSLSAIRQYHRQGLLRRAGVVSVSVGRETFLFRSQLGRLNSLRDRGIARRVAAAKAAYSR